MYGKLGTELSSSNVQDAIMGDHNNDCCILRSCRHIVTFSKDTGQEDGEMKAEEVHILYISIIFPKHIPPNYSYFSR